MMLTCTGKTIQILKDSLKPQLLLLFLVVLVLSSCIPVGEKEVPQPSETLASKASLTSEPADTPTLEPTDTLVPIPTDSQCNLTFERREMKEPYQRNKSTNDARYTLSMDELDDFLAVMGIEALCVPAGLGAPFVNVDWNALDGGPGVGRMISIGFEDLYEGSGWSRGFILYSTYDFAWGTEYDTFADREDLDTLQQGTMPDMIHVDGVDGFVRIAQSNFCFGFCTAYKTYVFPFESYYVAIVYDLGAYDAEENWDSMLQDFRDGKYPADAQDDLAAIDFLVSSLQFQD